MALPPFEGPRLKIQRGSRHLQELGLILARYGANLRVEYQPIKGDDDHVRLAFSLPPPPEIALVLGDVVHNFRSALDIMICDIARLKGKSSDKLKFPFAATREAYTNLLKGEIRRLGPDVAEALLELAPYKGGNMLLRGLHDLDVLDKHELVIPVMPCVWGHMDMAKIAMDSLRAANPGKSVPLVFFNGDYGPYMRSLDTEGARVRKSSIGDIARDRGPLPVLFADGLPFGRQHVVPTLEGLAKLAFEIVESFAAKFGSGNDDARGSPTRDNGDIHGG